MTVEEKPDLEKKEEKFAKPEIKGLFKKRKRKANAERSNTLSKLKFQKILQKCKKKHF